MLQENPVGSIKDDRDIQAEEEEEQGEENDAQISDDPSNLNTSSLPTPKRPKTGRQRDRTSAMMTSALNILKTASSNLNKPATETDEMTSFFNYVSQKSKNYSPATKIGVQHAIFEIIMKADRGFYDWNLDNTHYRPHQQMQPYGPQGPAQVYPNCDTTLPHVSIPHHGSEVQPNYTDLAPASQAR